MFGSKVTLSKIDPKKELDRQLTQMKMTQNAYIAKIVEGNFRQLLAESAQKYGTYVASWRVSMGRRESASGYDQQPARDPSQWYRVGSSEAIGLATRANADVWDDMLTYAVTSRALYPNVVIYNNTPHAEIAEGGPLRPANQEAIGAFARFEAALQADLNKMVIL